LQQITLGCGKMRLGRAAKPDIGARILRLGTDLRQDLAGGFARHGNANASIALKAGGDRLTPISGWRANHVEAALRRGGQSRNQQASQTHEQVKGLFHDASPMSARQCADVAIPARNQASAF
jgi:hypothetical protein